MPKKAILIHGWEGSPENGWFPWLRQKLAKENWEVVAPQMPNHDTPNMEKWLEYLDKKIPKLDENCYFVGHSLGCITILRFLEYLNKDSQIGGVILVAGFSSNLGIKEIKSFFQNEIDWKKIKTHCDKFVAIHSDNDHFVSTHYGDLFQEYLDAKKYIEHGMGHMSKQSELPIVYKIISDL